MLGLCFASALPLFEIHEGLCLCSYFDTWSALASLCFDPSFICYSDSKSVIRVITGNRKASKPNL